MPFLTPDGCCLSMLRCIYSGHLLMWTAACFIIARYTNIIVPGRAAKLLAGGVWAGTAGLWIVLTIKSESHLLHRFTPPSLSH